MSIDKINRREFLVSASALSAGALGLAQNEPDFSKVQMKTTHVAGNIYMLQGQGGNIAATVGDDGIAIVDDEYAPLADKIRAALKDITGSDKPVRFVINTHYHGDHTGSNVSFGETSTIIAQENVRKRLAAGGITGTGSPSFHRENKPAPKISLPLITFEHDVTVHLNGEDIHALHFPAGHTDGDSVIFYTHSNVVHMGDDFVRYGLPFIDIDGGGSVQGMIDACEKVIPQLPADVKVIPGHGDLATMEDVRAYVGMLHETSNAVQKALKKGRTLDEMKKQKVLDPWQKFSGPFINTDAFIETLYNSLSGKKKGKLMKHNA